MKVEKIKDAVFDALQDATSVVNPVIGDAVKQHNVNEENLRKVLTARGFGEVFTGATKQEEPKKLQEPKAQLDESLFASENLNETANTSYKPGEVADDWEEDPDNYAKEINKKTGEHRDRKMIPSDSWKKLSDRQKEDFDLWDSVYADLVKMPAWSSDNTRDRLRGISDEEMPNKKRYKDNNIGIDSDGNIRVNVENPENLAFAKQVAKHYGLPTRIYHTERKVRYPYSIVIYIPDPEQDEADAITNRVLADS